MTQPPRSPRMQQLPPQLSPRLSPRESSAFSVFKKKEKFAGPSVAEVTKSATREGYLVKQGGSRKNWKTRYFVLVADTIFYFKDRNAAAPCGIIRLDDKCKVSPGTFGKANSFELRTPVRIYYIYAERAADSHAWIDTITTLVSGQDTGKRGVNTTRGF